MKLNKILSTPVATTASTVTAQCLTIQLGPLGQILPSNHSRMVCESLNEAIKNLNPNTHGEFTLSKLVTSLQQVLALSSEFANIDIRGLPMCVNLIAYYLYAQPLKDQEAFQLLLPRNWNGEWDTFYKLGRIGFTLIDNPNDPSIRVWIRQAEALLKNDLPKFLIWLTHFVDIQTYVSIRFLSDDAEATPFFPKSDLFKKDPGLLLEIGSWFHAIQILMKTEGISQQCTVLQKQLVELLTANQLIPEFPVIESICKEIGDYMNLKILESITADASTLAPPQTFEERDAFLYSVAQIGEYCTAKKISKATQREAPKIEWASFSGLRDIIEHSNESNRYEMLSDLLDGEFAYLQITVERLLDDIKRLHQEVTLFIQKKYGSPDQRFMQRPIEPVVVTTKNSTLKKKEAQPLIDLISKEWKNPNERKSKIACWQDVFQNTTILTYENWAQILNLKSKYPVRAQELSTLLNKLIAARNSKLNHIASQSKMNRSEIDELLKLANLIGTESDWLQILNKKIPMPSFRERMNEALLLDKGPVRNRFLVLTSILDHCAQSFQRTLHLFRSQDKTVIHYRIDDLQNAIQHFSRIASILHDEHHITDPQFMESAMKLAAAIQLFPQESNPFRETLISDVVKLFQHQHTTQMPKTLLKPILKKALIYNLTQGLKTLKFIIKFPENRQNSFLSNHYYELKKVRNTLVHSDYALEMQRLSINDLLSSTSRLTDLIYTELNTIADEVRLKHQRNIERATQLLSNLEDEVCRLKNRYQLTPTPGNLKKIKIADSTLAAVSLKIDEIQKSGFPTRDQILSDYLDQKKCI